MDQISFRSARAAASSFSLLWNTFLPYTFLIHFLCSSGFHRLRLAVLSATRTRLATGLESRVMRIYSSICSAASASGQRWRRSRMVIVFTKVSVTCFTLDARKETKGETPAKTRTRERVRSRVIADNSHLTRVAPLAVRAAPCQHVRNQYRRPSR